MFFTRTRARHILPSMLLIAAPLAEELETALKLCGRKTRTRVAGRTIWSAERAGTPLHLLKLGVGPVRAAAALDHALTHMQFTRILVIGYAGALDPALKQGELVTVTHADLLSAKPRGAPLDELGIEGGWELHEAPALMVLARAAGVAAHMGTAITTPWIVGSPEQKRVLAGRFRALIVDMETAALARVASNHGVPLSCVRAVSDEAEDDFLAAFSYAPSAGPVQRAAQVLAGGEWIRRVREWRERSLAARDSLEHFLAHYLDANARTHRLPAR